MADDTTRQAPPKEGSNRGHDTDNQRANITDTMSGLHPKENSEHTDDGPPNGTEPEEVDQVEKEMEVAREHADPTRGDKVVDSGDRVSTEGGGNPQE